MNLNLEGGLEDGVLIADGVGEGSNDGDSNL